MNMKEELVIDRDFVEYEEVLELKKLGFDESCLKSYSITDVDEGGNTIFSPKLQLFNDPNYVSAPLYQQAFRWFREKYGLYHQIEEFVMYGTQCFTCTITGKVGYESEEGWGTYEEAELYCFRKLIEMVNSI